MPANADAEAHGGCGFAHELATIRSPRRGVDFTTTYGYFDPSRRKAVQLSWTTDMNVSPKLRLDYWRCLLSIEDFLRIAGCGIICARATLDFMTAFRTPQTFVEKSFVNPSDPGVTSCRRRAAKGRKDSFRFHQDF